MDCDKSNGGGGVERSGQGNFIASKQRKTGKVEETANLKISGRHCVREVSSSFLMWSLTSRFAEKGRKGEKEGKKFVNRVNATKAGEIVTEGK